MARLVSEHRYANLQLLNLGGNNLTSIEALVRTDMPKLEELWLWKNKLTTVDCLYKLQAPCLKGIDISNNYVKAWPRFGELVSRNIL